MFPVVQKWVSLYHAPVPRPETTCYVSTFEYSRPLPSARSFRVFHLSRPRRAGDRARDDLSTVLRGRIEVVDLDGDCRYNALSYCWEGSIEPSPYAHQRRDRIVVEETDGSTSQLLISPALSTALRYLRIQGQPLPLFIDQICINQADKAEKSQQINLMGDIYRGCECVVSWLDVATRYTDALFDFLPRVSENELLLQLMQNPPRASALLQSGIERRADFGGDETLRQDVEGMTALTREHWLHFPHRGFLEMCMRRWFRRIWIVQEACLGREMVFVCGRRSCSAGALEAVSQFKMLASTIQHLEGATRPGHYRPPRHDADAKHRAFMATTLVFRIFRERAAAWETPAHTNGSQMRRGLDNLVVRFNVDTMAQGPSARLGSSDPKDYIYALKGLAPADDPVSTQLPATKTVPKLPSWVPDWSTHLTNPHGYRTGCFPVFGAGGTNTTAEIDLATPGILKFRGRPLCTVAHVGTHFMHLSDRRLVGPLESPTIVARSIFGFFREVRALCRRAAACPAAASFAAESVERVVWVTSTGGHGLSETTERSLLGGDVEDGTCLLGELWELQLRMDVWPEIWRRRRDGMNGVRGTWVRMREVLGGGGSALARLGADFMYWVGRAGIELRHVYWLWKYLCALPYVWWRRESEDMIYHGVFGVQRDSQIGILKSVLALQVRRKCFVSGAGHVGLGPVGTRAGDVVVVPQGASHPAILRPADMEGQPWEYVGEAYCHGFMEGEAFADDEVETTWFEIK
ncbi:heterokaryon incompatibility protein-domain-containing protein [Lasiosphaeris hirsuta]|uniref:Heterokaryon incompatibility protein-domain-containing protein n=1 Tax=Lasiosphaeris hirsuta TaxID=260670 RepID=A0AA40AGA6_9PEZI|nr:heterokaryon incompatibility protein-domain-containing protein [Lasiosphaeris hirsuta]